MNFHRIKSALDVSASVACLLICAFCLVATIGRYVKTPAAADTKPQVVRPGLQLEMSFPTIPGFDYNQHDKSILFFLDSECSHCIKSIPVYHALFETAQKRAPKTLALLGLFEKDLGLRNFTSLGFDIPAKVNVSFAKYSIAATPTVVVVDRRGNIHNFWVGELTADAVRTLTHLLSATP